MIKGIFPPIPTPFIDNEVAIDKLESNIIKWNATGLAGYVVMGSNGEGIFLTNQEKLQIVDTAKKYARPDQLIIAGTGSDNYKETILLTNDAEQRGADYALIITPSYYKNQMTHEALIDYFTRVADDVKIPVLIYNVPKFTGVNIKAETVAELAQHQNMVGIKSSSDSIPDLESIIDKTPDDFSVLIGTASVLYAALSVGASGAIVALANIAPLECLEIEKLNELRKPKEALDLQMKMLRPNLAVTVTYGIAGLKSALEFLDYYGGPVRCPLQDLGEREKNELYLILQEAGIIKKSLI